MSHGCWVWSSFAGAEGDDVHTIGDDTGGASGNLDIEAQLDSCTLTALCGIRSAGVLYFFRKNQADGVCAGRGMCFKGRGGSQPH